MVERYIRDVEVASSNLVASNREVVEAWLSLVERYIRDVEVASSNLVASTFLNSLKRCLQCFGEFFLFKKEFSRYNGERISFR